MKIVLYLILLVFIKVNLLSYDKVRIVAPRSNYDTNHIYFYTLLQSILDVTKDEYKKSYVEYNHNFEQGRAFAKLKSGKKIDIHWAGTNLKREEEFLSVKIPLIKGLLGYRMFIINKKNIKTFDEINTFEDLKKLKACQGTHWPDTKVLKHSGIKVVQNSNYEAMFLQVLNGRCDYFPRGVNEAFIEIKARKHKYQDLVLYKKIILYYPFPMYFFLNKKSITLKNRVEKGLLKLIEDKSFERYLRSSQNTKNLFPLSSWMNVKIFKLANPYLSKETDINNAKFWIIP